MLFRQYFEMETCTYTYLLADDYGCDAILIDPVFEKLDLYMTVLKEYDLTLTQCLDTHVHADHVTASGHLRKLTGCEIAMGAKTKAACVTRHLSDGDEVSAGQISLKVLHTPGHTDDSYCYLGSDRIFTGDTLLIRATGRTDFQHGDTDDAYNSIFSKLLTLPEDTLVYPAHDYEGRMCSTIGEEKRFNPRLQVKNVEEYREIMDNLNLPQPDKMAIAVPLNLNCGLEA